MGVLSSILSESERIKGIMCKILTKNDDSGRHGVLIPVEAYRMFPEINGFVPDIAVNYTEDITTLWSGPEIKRSKYKHYHRYPERRITRLRGDVNDVPPGTLIIVGRIAEEDRLYEIHVLQPSHPQYQAVLDEVGIGSEPGAFLDRKSVV